MKILKHFITITKHKLCVMKLCRKAGIPLRGLVHDLSKYSFVEFSEGVRYYKGDGISPISHCKKELGYSKAWLHHTGRNKHHFEYWYDPAAPNPTPIMPYKYAVELICDCIAASITYKKKKWQNTNPLEYFTNRKDKYMINSKIAEFITVIFEELASSDIDRVINKKNLKSKYKSIIK